VVQAFFQVHCLGVLKTWTIRDRAAIGLKGPSVWLADACNSRKLQNESDGSTNLPREEVFWVEPFGDKKPPSSPICTPVHLYILISLVVKKPHLIDAFVKRFVLLNALSKPAGDW